MVTPTLVKPGVGDPPDRLPTDGFQDPDDWAFFMMGDGAEQVEDAGAGQVDSSSKPDMVAPIKSVAELEGHFGHDWVY